MPERYTRHWANLYQYAACTAEWSQCDWFLWLLITSQLATHTRENEQASVILSYKKKNLLSHTSQRSVTGPSSYSAKSSHTKDRFLSGSSYFHPTLIVTVCIKHVAQQVGCNQCLCRCWCAGVDVWLVTVRSGTFVGVPIKPIHSSVSLPPRCQQHQELCSYKHFVIGHKASVMNSVSWSCYCLISCGIAIANVVKSV